MAADSESMLDPKTPEEVVIAAWPREPVEDPTLGIAVDGGAEGTPRHRLVALGDSFTHGFQSGAIHNTDASYPALVAREMGWQRFFRYPTYFGFGGPPLNLEFLVRELEHEFGDRVDWWEVPLAPFRARHFAGLVEDWWVWGPGARVPNVKAINHNLGLSGWDLRDTLQRTAERLKKEIEGPEDRLFGQFIEKANERAALRVLKSAKDHHSGKSLTPFETATELSQEGTHESPGEGDGIETLIVFLGVNNVLPSILRLEVVWSKDGFYDLDLKEQFTVWNPVHFKAELDLAVEEIKKIRARHVILCTIPHVTIAPTARGVGSKVRKGSRYFPYYTRPWIRDRDFDPKKDPHITGAEARAIDSAIDQYNDAITEAVEHARAEGRDWYVFEAAGLFDRLAIRRYIDDPSARPLWWEEYELPSELATLSSEPNTRFLATGPDGRTDGGLFSLDGIHPTTVGYGILAQELINIMQHHVGVRFYRRDGRTERRYPVKVDFGRLIARDRLFSDPPRSLTFDPLVIGWIDEVLDGFFDKML